MAHRRAEFRCILPLPSAEMGPMSSETPYFDLPVNLPHAFTVIGRIGRILMSQGADQSLQLAAQIAEVLEPHRWEDPPAAEAETPRQLAAEIARKMVEAMIYEEHQGDRLGQCVRNLFECLGMGKEGALLSLRVGEDPKSLMRPV